MCIWWYPASIPLCRHSKLEVLDLGGPYGNCLGSYELETASLEGQFKLLPKLCSLNFPLHGEDPELADAIIAHLPSLQSLDVFVWDYADSVCNGVSRFQNLVELYLFFSSRHDQSEPTLRKIAEACPSLRFFSINVCDEIVDGYDISADDPDSSSSNARISEADLRHMALRLPALERFGSNLFFWLVHSPSLTSLKSGKDEKLSMDDLLEQNRRQIENVLDEVAPNLRKLDARYFRFSEDWNDDWEVMQWLCKVIDEKG